MYPHVFLEFRTGPDENFVTVWTFVCTAPNLSLYFVFVRQKVIELFYVGVWMDLFSMFLQFRHPEYRKNIKTETVTSQCLLSFNCLFRQLFNVKTLGRFLETISHFAELEKLLFYQYLTVQKNTDFLNYISIIKIFFSFSNIYIHVLSEKKIFEAVYGATYVSNCSLHDGHSKPFSPLCFIAWFHSCVLVYAT